MASDHAPGASEDAPSDLSRVLDRGVVEGIISAAQRDGLARLARLAAAGDAAARAAVPAMRAAPSALSVVSVAYALGALLVLFACGWFLLDRWERLGAWGVLGVASGYATVLAAAAWWLRQHRFALAADIATALVVALTPLVTWPFLSLSGRWPTVAVHAPRLVDPLLRDQAWMAWQWLILELVMLLVALVVVRLRPIVAVTWPLAGALGGVALHVSIIARSFGGSNDSEQWMILGGGFAVLLVAERVERWQRRVRRPAGVAADDMMSGEPIGDCAAAFWSVGLAVSTIAFLAIWLRADDSAWRHLLLPLALALVGLSLYLRRRLVLLFGVLGVVGYLGFLAQHVFRDYVSFPILLAGLGILVILATVWTQTRFPQLVERLEARRGSDERPFPWSSPMAALPLGIALAMSTLGHAESAEERAREDFRQRLTILRQHSGSLPLAGGSPNRKGAPPPGRASPRDSSDHPPPPPAVERRNLPPGRS